MMNRTYYYLHTNGELISKPAFVVESAGVEDYFNSPMVRKWWVATTDKDVRQIERQADVLRKLGQKADGFKFDGQLMEIS